MLFNLIDESAESPAGDDTTGVSEQWRTSLEKNLQQRPLTYLPLEAVIPDPDQPRRHFDEESLLDLAQSIEENGLLQPIVVQPADASGHYRLIMGERRWRAHEFAGLTHIPAIIRPASDTTVLALQIIENNQREDIAPLEEAHALQRLVELSGQKKQVAQILGRSPSWLSKRLSLLNAPEPVQRFAREQSVKDINTLNSLARLYDEAPEQAQQLMGDIEVSGPNGSFRERVEQQRQLLRQQSSDASQDAADNLPAGIETPASPSHVEAALMHLQQLRLTPLKSLSGISSLEMSFPELEQRFRRYLQSADTKQTFPSLWQSFIDQYLPDS